MPKGARKWWKKMANGYPVSQEFRQRGAGMCSAAGEGGGRMAIPG